MYRRNVMEETSGCDVWKVMRCSDLRSDVKNALWFGAPAYQGERDLSTEDVWSQSDASNVIWTTHVVTRVTQCSKISCSSVMKGVA